MVARRSDPDSADYPDEGALRAALAESEARVEELSVQLDELMAEGREFLTESAHTVRGALTITYSYLEILHADLSEGLTEEQRSFVEIAYQNAEKVRLLVEDLVELASLETGAAQIDIAPAQVNEIISEVQRDSGSLAEEKGLSLRAELADDVPKIQVDARRLANIVSRLVDNAIRFTPQGGRVVLRSRTDQDTVSIEVADNGLGIPAGREAECMKPFGQCHRKPGENRIGFGLGLPLCRRQVEAFGGTLDLTSSEGEGTTVTIRIPTVGHE